MSIMVKYLQYYTKSFISVLCFQFSLRFPTLIIKFSKYFRVEIMDQRLSLSKKSLTVLLPCTMSTISQTRLADQCHGSTPKLNQQFSAQVEVDPLLSHMTMTNLTVKDTLWLVALEAVDILNFLLKEKQPVPFRSLIANRY